MRILDKSDQLIAEHFVLGDIDLVEAVAQLRSVEITDHDIVELLTSTVRAARSPHKRTPRQSSQMEKHWFDLCNTLATLWFGIKNAEDAERIRDVMTPHLDVIQREVLTERSKT